MAAMHRTVGLDTVKRYVTLKTGRIHNLPIAILMPHSSCNCRCVMCDIWLGNANRQQLSRADIESLLESFRQLGTRWVVMSGGEALMNPNLFQLCRLLKDNGIQKISILSTGLLLEKYAPEVVEGVDEVVVSLDGSEPIHDAVRRVPRAFRRLEEGVQAVKRLQPDFPITGRCVVQRLNFADWPNIIDAARAIGLDHISFLAADISTDAFNRPELWDEQRTIEVNLEPEQLPIMRSVLEALVVDYAADFENNFIAESPSKLWHIYDYYAALHKEAPFPAVQCNAPWVSAVIEADGTVRPCFFHRPMGNIHDAPLLDLVNRPEEIAFRQNLDMDRDEICRKCVCTLNLRPTAKLANKLGGRPAQCRHRIKKQGDR
jgi:MoaA/NifB/PqqE/SkfB family radical SAM enzyme